ncbi:MAG: hypothetical protein DWI00_05835 [Planctomycetota bacterium]|nr:MAG: hypothetical protein DWI00_05835 [Planctomycetota bacterium]
MNLNQFSGTLFLVIAVCKARHSIGATDNFGTAAVKAVYRVGDFHVPRTRPMGLHGNRPDNTQGWIL